MRALASVATSFVALIGASCSVYAANITKPHSSTQLLPIDFKPAQVFEHVNLVRNINLEKSYARETINIVVENVAKEAQTNYYLPFADNVVANVGGIEVKDKKNPEGAAFEIKLVEFDPASSTQFYQIRLPSPLLPKSQITLAISYAVLSSLTPLPTTIGQNDKQYLMYSFSALFPSSYKTRQQKTKVKLPSTDIPDFTILPAAHSSENKEDPVKQGTTLTYGSFGQVPAGAVEPVSIRYEFTKPVNHITLLERDLEISHWGANLATEERYWYQNRAASIKGHFDRVQYAASSYYRPETHALKTFNLPLRKRSFDPYFVDDIGNISTSSWRPSGREQLLELRPRFPIFGGWRFKFKVGWNSYLGDSVRQSTGHTYILKVPFFEGFKQSEGASYEVVKVRVVLPEGASNVQFDTGEISTVSSDITLHRTFLDTVGRTTLTLTAVNLFDELRGKDLIVSYHYPRFAGLRKPLTIFAGVFAIFASAWLMSQVDISIGKK